ncbi:MAG: MarR family transcriptional regulator [Planctomycetota bacterium]
MSTDPLNMNRQTSLEEGISAALRNIVRAVDLQSRLLVVEHGLTAPQISILRAAFQLGRATTGELARAARLSQPTVTGILDRLERKTLVTRCRHDRDRRNIIVTVTALGAAALHAVPSPLHERFRRELVKLENWEQTMILATLQRVARMMDGGPAEESMCPATEPDALCLPTEQEALVAGNPV